MKKISLLLLVVILLAPGVLTACSNTEESVPLLLEPAVVDTDAAPAKVQELYDMTYYEGLVVPKVAEMSFAAGGIIAEVNVCLGSSVKTGDILAQLDVGLAQNMIDSLTDSIEMSRKSNALTNKIAECDIEIAKTELAQLEESEAEATTIELKKTQIDGLRNSYNSAVALQALALEQSSTQLANYQSIVDNSVVIATCDGTVIYCGATIGGWAQAYVTLIWVADDNTSCITCDYISTDELDSADQVYATVDGARAEITNVPYDRVTFLSMLASNTPLKSIFTINEAQTSPENGMFSYIFVINDYVEEALVVPVNSVVLEDAQFYVYVISPDGMQTRRLVKLGIRTEALVQITQGLEEGELVYVGN